MVNLDNVNLDGTHVKQATTKELWHHHVPLLKEDTTMMMLVIIPPQP